jgi:hypothetical protein
MFTPGTLRLGSPRSSSSYRRRTARRPSPCPGSHCYYGTGPQPYGSSSRASPQSKNLRWVSSTRPNRSRSRPGSCQSRTHSESARRERPRRTRTRSRCRTGYRSSTGHTGKLGNRSPARYFRSVCIGRWSRRRSSPGTRSRSHSCRSPPRKTASRPRPADRAGAWPSSCRGLAGGSSAGRGRCRARCRRRTQGGRCPGSRDHRRRQPPRRLGRSMR